LASVVGASSVGAGRFGGARGAPAQASPQESARETTDFEYELFAAVLEGLYVDGVSNEAVDAITAKDPEHGYPANFVWACPVCMPAYRAFLTYRARPHFEWIKGPQDFGPGLDAATVAELTTGEFAARQQALMQLVGRWVERRMGRLRLTPEERAEWKLEMERRRKKGMAQLADYQSCGLGGSYARMKACPLCDGANEPFQPPTRRR
jgi:hypothetical protein